MPNNAMNPIALLDMDGTVADFATRMQEEMRKLQSPGEPDFTADAFDYDQPHLNERMRLIKRQEGFWQNLPPLAAGMKVVRALHDFSYDIHVLTKGPRRSPIAWREKVSWCDEHLAHVPHKVTVTEDKGLVYGKVLVDDYPEYIQAWLAWRPRGVVIMPHQPWNANFKHPQVFRYHDAVHDATAKMRALLAKTAVTFREQMYERGAQEVI